MLTQASFMLIITDIITIIFPRYVRQKKFIYHFLFDVFRLLSERLKVVA